MKKILVSTIAAASLVVAAQAAEKNPDALVTHTELGYIQTNGNTDTKTFNLDANAKKAWGKHQGSLKLDGQYGSADGIENKKKYLIEANYDYSITDRLAFNYLAGYKSDIYSGFDYQFYTGPGAKYQAIKMDNHNLSLTANILYSEDKYHNAAPGTDDTNNYTGYRAQGIYLWDIVNNLKFTQELGIRGAFDDSENYFATSKTALTTKISDIFSAGISYKIDYVNQQRPGLENKDTTFTANLIMDY
jgi:putative salt-induced outer membrane protein